MTSDDKKKWGTIFLDASRESSLSKLDAMQAASRQEQWNQKTQQDYLEKVRQKAIDRAREILGEAYTERQNVLDEAERDAERIRNEAKAVYASAEETRNQTQDLRHSIQAEFDNASHIRQGAQEEGFQHGLSAAQEELNNFRAAMGSSVAGVLQAIESQCMQVFENWRAELVDLLKVCVEKGTNLVLNERHEEILKKMILEAVRNLDDRRLVTLRVHPDDEEVVADLFSAAKEKNPDLGQWRIVADSSLQLGDIIAESHTGTVDSRLQLFRDMVDNILRHLALPPSQADEDAKDAVHVRLEEEIDTVMALAPPPSAQNIEPDAPTQEPQEAEQVTEAGEAFETAEPAQTSLQEDLAQNAEPLEAEAPLAEPASIEEVSPLEASPAQVNFEEDKPESTREPAESTADLEAELMGAEEQTPYAAHEPTMEELEAELLPLDDDFEDEAADDKDFFEQELFEENPLVTANQTLASPMPPEVEEPQKIDFSINPSDQDSDIIDLDEPIVKGKA